MSPSTWDVTSRARSPRHTLSRFVAEEQAAARETAAAAAAATAAALATDEGSRDGDGDVHGSEAAGDAVYGSGMDGRSRGRVESVASVQP